MGNQHSDMTDGSMERDQALERRVHRQDGRQHSNSLIIAGEKLSTPSEFVLVPVSVAARNSCCSLRRRGDAAATPTASLSAVAATTVTTEPPPLARIPLLDGDNIVGAGASNRLGLGIPKDTKNVAEKQVLLRTTNAPRGSVLLKAFSSSVRIRRRDSARATPPPSPRLPRSPRSPRSPRPTRSPRSPPRSPWSARRGGHATSKCDTSTGGGGRGGRGDGGGSTSVVAAGAQQYLLVGETLDLDAADSSQSAYSYTLEYASAATTAATSDPPPRFANSSISNGNRNSHSSRKNGSGFWPVLAPRGVDLTGQLPGARGTPKTATPSTASSSARGGVSGGNGGTTAKRRLEGIFVADDTGTVSRMMARDAQSARTDVARDIHGAESTRHRSSPGATAVDASDSGPRQERARGSTTPTCGPSRKRQRDGDRTSTSPFCPSGVIDLCDLDDLPVDAGASKDQPLDLCDSDDEGLVEHVRLAAEAEEQASCVVCIAVVSPVKRSYAANLPPPGPGGTEDARGLAVATVVRPVSFCELERSPATAAWALSPTWERSTPSTGEKLDADEDKDKEKDDDGKREASLLSSSLSPKKPRPPPSPPLAQPTEQRGEKEDRTRPVIRSLPPVGVSAAVSIEADSARADVVASITTAAAAVKEEAATAPPPVQRPPTTRSLPCNGHQFLSILKPYIQDCPEVALGATEEVLASGARLPSGLCGLIMTELLKSRCKFRTEFLRRQLRAVLSAPPSSSSSSPSSSSGCCWRPPDNAPGWLEAVMLGITRNDDGDGDGGGGDSSSALARASAIAALDAHVAVLEVVVNYLVSGGPSAEGRDRVGQLFALEGQAKRKAGKAKTGPMEMARRAVERCADWAVGAWSAAASVRGHRGYGPAGGSARHVGDLDPARARARLLTVRLLSGVVEACGLPVREACVAILDRMDAVGLPPAVAREVDAGKGASAAYSQGGCDEGGGGGGGGGAVTLPRRRLGAVACEGLVRALCWRPFGAELARVLSADLPAAGSAAGDVEADVVRLRLILSRAIRRASGGAGGCLLLS